MVWRLPLASSAGATAFRTLLHRYRLSDALSATQGSINVCLMRRRSRTGKFQRCESRVAKRCSWDRKAALRLTSVMTLLAHCSHKLRIGATVLRAETAAVGRDGVVGKFVERLCRGRLRSCERSR